MSLGVSSRRTILHASQSINDALAVPNRVFHEDIDIFRGAHQTVQDARLPATHEILSASFIEKAARTKQRELRLQGHQRRGLL
jgi:hypothetical protein